MLFVPNTFPPKLQVLWHATKNVRPVDIIHSRSLWLYPQKATGCKFVKLISTSVLWRTCTIIWYGPTAAVTVAAAVSTYRESAHRDRQRPSLALIHMAAVAITFHNVPERSAEKFPLRRNNFIVKMWAVDDVHRLWWLPQVFRLAKVLWGFVERNLRQIMLALHILKKTTVTQLTDNAIMTNDVSLWFFGQSNFLSFSPPLSLSLSLSLSPFFSFSSHWPFKKSNRAHN
jgi:hypothetical protein